MLLLNQPSSLDLKYFPRQLSDRPNFSLTYNNRDIDYTKQTSTPSTIDATPDKISNKIFKRCFVSRTISFRVSLYAMALLIRSIFADPTSGISIDSCKSMRRRMALSYSMSVSEHSSIKTASSSSINSAIARISFAMEITVRFP
jgi:hypothetical protein